MDTRPHGLHIQSNSVYPLRPEPDVSKGRSSDENRDGAAGAGAGVPSAGAQVRLRGAAASREKGGWRCSPSQDLPRLQQLRSQAAAAGRSTPAPAVGRSSPPRRPRPQPCLLQLHRLGCRPGTGAPRRCVRRKGLGSREARARSRQRTAEAGRVPAHNPQARTHLHARLQPRSPAQGGDRGSAEPPRCGPLGPASGPRYVSPRPQATIGRASGGAGRGQRRATAGGAKRGGGWGAGSQGRSREPRPRSCYLLRLLPDLWAFSGPSSSLPSDSQGFPGSIPFKSSCLRSDQTETPLLVAECFIVPCVKEIRFTNEGLHYLYLDK